jgi:hypothetical protein
MAGGEVDDGRRLRGVIYGRRLRGGCDGRSVRWRRWQAVCEVDAMAGGCEVNRTSVPREWLSSPHSPHCSAELFNHLLQSAAGRCRRSGAPSPGFRPPAVAYACLVAD